jgi:hypothetical protein
MGRYGLLVAMMLAVTGTFVALVACSAQLAGTGPIPANDASVDAPMEADAAGSDVAVEGAAEAGCPGLTCNGQCISEPDCRSCAGAPLLCGTTKTCTASCHDCNDTAGSILPIECFACDSNHQNPIGTCQYDDPLSYCLNGEYLGAYQGGTGYRCACADVSSCPGATQVCVKLGSYDGGFCLTCGENTIGAIQGQPCKDGGTCQENTAACQ